mmetsp:Transcript_30087/g.61956  ORF Transcript_30087/g.61956 Transcript_30087/m.61956 type:complete len:121 (+) Transcript_30087:165-527(+)
MCWWDQQLWRQIRQCKWASAGEGCPFEDGDSLLVMLDAVEQEPRREVLQQAAKCPQWVVVTSQRDYETRSSTNWEQWGSNTSCYRNTQQRYMQRIGGKTGTKSNTREGNCFTGDSTERQT